MGRKKLTEDQKHGVTPLKLKFGELLHSYVRRAKLRQRELAPPLEITAPAFSQMLHGKLMPTLKQLQTLQEILKLSRNEFFALEYLLSMIHNGNQELLSPVNQLIFSLRCEKGFSREELVLLSGIPLETLTAFERCCNAQPSLDEARKLSEILGCSPDALMPANYLPEKFSRDEREKAEAELFHAADGTVFQDALEIPVLPLGAMTRFRFGMPFWEYVCKNSSKRMELAPQWGHQPMAMIYATAEELQLAIRGDVQLLVGDPEVMPAMSLELACARDGSWLLQEKVEGENRRFDGEPNTRRIRKLRCVLPVAEMKIVPLPRPATGETASAPDEGQDNEDEE